MSDFSLLQSSFSSLDVMTQVSAHNIANINTEGYRTEHAVLETGPSGEGVRVAAIQKDVAFGAAQPTNNVDLPREFSQLNIIENAYSATAVTMRTLDGMTGAILNVKV